MRQAIAAGALFGTLTGLLGWAYTGTPAVHAQTCQEDEPCWNCRTMGNGVCGALTDGPPCTDTDGHIVAYWPCYYLPNGRGGSDVYTPDER